MTAHVKIPVPRPGWVTGLLVAFIFVNGAIVGGGLTSIYIMTKAQEKVSTPEQMPDRVGDFLASKLSLTDEQSAKIRNILNERQAAIETIHFNVQPEIQSELELSREEIGKVLSPEQRAEWEKLFDNTRARMAPNHYQRRGSRMRGPGSDQNMMRNQFRNQERFIERNGEQLQGPPAPGEMRGPGRRDWREGVRPGQEGDRRRMGPDSWEQDRERRGPGPGRRIEQPQTPPEPPAEQPAPQELNENPPQGEE